MTNAQYKTLKKIKANEDALGRYLHPRCYDGRVVTGLLKRRWAELNFNGAVKITRTGRREIETESKRRGQVVSLSERIDRISRI